MLNVDLIKGAKEAAEFCGISRRTLYHLVERKEVPVIRKGKTLFFRRSELEATFRSEPGKPV